MNTEKTRTVYAVHPYWHGYLVLEGATSIVLHSESGSCGQYEMRPDRLIVKWAEYPTDVFIKIGPVYMHDSLLSATRFPENNLSCLVIDGKSIKIDLLSVKVPHMPRNAFIRPETSDKEVFSQIFIKNEYASALFPSHAYNIVDLGANIGLAAMYFANKYQDSRVLCVEPDVDNFSVLKSNVEYLSNRVSCINGAAWHYNGSINIIDRDATGNYLGCWGLQVSDSSKGAATTLSYRLERLYKEGGFDEVDLLKIDVEGAELELFSYSPEAWLNKTKFICIETHDRFRPGAERAVRRALSTKFEELPRSGENLLFKMKL